MKKDQPAGLPELKFEKPPRVMIVEARYYVKISDMLFEGAEKVLKQYKADFERFTVPGSLEIPAAIAMAARGEKFDAYVALGCVIRGETTHYEIVSGESARGLMNLSVEHALAIGNGILTVENEDQANARAKPDGEHNNGGGAAQAALMMLSLKQQLG